MRSDTNSVFKYPKYAEIRLEIQEGFPVIETPAYTAVETHGGDARRKGRSRRRRKKLFQADR
jgi:hypothetical protein